VSSTLFEHATLFDGVTPEVTEPAPGALADVLVVQGNPLKDLGLLAANGRSLVHIIVDGRLVK
jgi:hypothetical protein